MQSRVLRISVTSANERFAEDGGSAYSPRFDPVRSLVMRHLILERDTNLSVLLPLLYRVIFFVKYRASPLLNFIWNRIFHFSMWCCCILLRIVVAYITDLAICW